MGISKDRGSSCCICFIFFNMMFFALFALVAMASAHDQAWEDYKLEFNKHYTAEEEPVRYANWKKDTEEVGLHNAMFANEFTQGVNELSDLSDEEYKRLYLSSLLVPEGPSNATMYVPSNDAVPNAIDWRPLITDGGSSGLESSMTKELLGTRWDILQDPYWSSLVAARVSMA